MTNPRITRFEPPAETPEKIPDSNPQQKLDARRFDLANPPAPAVPVFRLGEATIATPGNLVLIQAKAKAGKSAAVGAIIAATMEPQGDCLGFASANPHGWAVVHFDTEQSPADHHRGIARALKRAGRADAPEWLRSYRLADLSSKERRALLAFELDRATTECGGIHSVLLDGFADLIIDPNDEGEAFPFVDELHQQAIRYGAPVLCVLHENPGSETGKTRGHLGSQLERKAETALRLEKGGDGVTVIFSERSRNAHIPKECGPRFAWSDEAAMHVSTETKSALKSDAKHAALRLLAEEVFRGVPDGVGLSWKQLHEGIQKVDGLKLDGARKRFAAMKTRNIIFQSGDRWRLGKL